MNADEFPDYILGFIFHKYLSERMHIYANSVLVADEIDFKDIDEGTEDGLACRYVRTLGTLAGLL